jgi:hypothetical protein
MGIVSKASKGAAQQRTLDVEHGIAVRLLEGTCQRLAEKRGELAALRGRLDAAPCEDVQERLAMVDRSYDLAAEIRALERASNDTDYMLQTSRILFRYYDIVEKTKATSTSTTTSTSTSKAASNAHATKAPERKDANSIMQYFTAAPQPSAVEADSDACDAGDAGDGEEAEAEDRATLLDAYRNVVQRNNLVSVPQVPLSHAAAAPGGKTRSVHTLHAAINNSKAQVASCGGNSKSKQQEMLASFDGAQAARRAAVTHDEPHASGPCEHCGHAKRTLIAQDGYMYCNGCFSVEYVIVDHERPSYKDPPKEITYFAYKRINHFNEWLNQIQGKETTDIPEDVYDKIRLEIKKLKIVNMSKLTRVTVKSILRKLRLNKYYEHATHIMHKVSGKSMPHIEVELEERLRHMFCQIQVPFLRHKPPTRKNFLSYSYVLHKFMLLLERDEYLPCCPLLRSRDKLMQQEVVFKKICEDLGWEFVRSL